MVSDAQQGLEHCRSQLDQRPRELTRLEVTQRATQDFDTHAWRYQRIADLDQRLDRHWTEVVVAAAQAGDPFAYGRDRLERAYRSLLHCRQASPHEALVERQVCDLERAVLTSRPGQRLERTPVDERACRVRQVGEWPELARNLQLERDHGHELGIGMWAIGIAPQRDRRRTTNAHQFRTFDTASFRDCRANKVRQGRELHRGYDLASNASLIGTLGAVSAGPSTRGTRRRQGKSDRKE
jgi:hypothetical protein